MFSVLRGILVALAANALFNVIYECSAAVQLQDGTLGEVVTVDGFAN